MSIVPLNVRVNLSGVPGVQSTENAGTKGNPCMTAADERQLVLRAKEGHHDAFTVLVQRYMRQAYNIAFGFVNDHDDAEDVAQESFVRIYRSLGGFRGDAEFSTWLYRIVTNLSLNRLRQNRHSAKREVREIDCPGGGPPPDNSEMHALIERALHDLPTLQRATVILRHLNDLSTRQVSEILQCSEGTVKTHLHRGLKKMKKSMRFLEEELE